MAPIPNWMDELFAWADKNNISENKLPRDKDVAQIKTLNLENQKIIELPNSIGNLVNLQTLFLQGNQLTSLPQSIGNLINLKHLRLSGNQFVQLPDSISNLTNVEQLGLKSIGLTIIPEFIGKLTRLIELDLSNNKIAEIPEFIGALTRLTKLDLSNNKLMEIPVIVGELIYTTQLDLSNNQITVIPEFIQHLTFLTKLYLSNNQIEKIPSFIGDLNNLKWLNIHDQKNPFIEIAPNIFTMPNGQNRLIENKYTLQQLANELNMKKSSYIQKILFGSPGTGKSHKIQETLSKQDGLGIQHSENIIKTVFHPEYTYGDFVGKLMPITVGGNVQYKFYEGHFLKALSQAYKNIIAAQDNDGEIEKVALVIDEINRGNSAAIFGTIFQLLDRKPDGWSSYEVSVNEIIFNRLFELCDLKIHSHVTGTEKVSTYKLGNEEILASNLQDRLRFLNCHFENRTIKIPPNLSILASMNTSDSSIYYMDSAFKRRWEWEFIDVDPDNNKPAKGAAFKTENEWNAFVKKLNDFIKSNHKSIRGIEDKQIGQRFINFDNEGEISNSSIQNKLMFFLWDSVFNRDKKPLIDLLFGKDTKHDELPLITFGDFAKEVDLFIKKINER